MVMSNSKIHSTYDGLYDEVRDDREEFIDDAAFRLKVDELIKIGFIETSLLDDVTLYSAKPGLKWPQIVHIDDSVKKEILLILIENPTTFFVLQNTQKGKMRIASLELKKWGEDKSVKVVAFMIVDNDQTLSEQSVDGVKRTFGDQKVTIFALSSSSKTTFEHIKTYIDAYASDVVHEDKEPEYPMPLIALLANPKQNEKMLRLFHHIHRKALDRSPLRYGIIWDEADKTYKSLRDKNVIVAGANVSCRTFIIDNNEALYRLGFVTATDGNLLDELDYPECANAYLYPVDIPQEDQIYYRALHHRESITHRVPFTSKHTNNIYATEILEANTPHFMRPIVLQSGEVYYRKIIVNSNTKTYDMQQFAKWSNKKDMYAMIFNGYGGASVKVFRQGFAIETYKTKGKRLNEILFYIYKKLGLHDKPLIIVGRRKVDRGLGFHYCPKSDSEITIEGDKGPLITKNREGLVWTDEILGRIEDKNTAVQKAGRLAGIIGNSPQYPGSTHYWTDEYTENLIRRHNTIVDASNTVSGCSVLQAVRQAENSTPTVKVNHRVPIDKFLVYTNEDTVRKVCEILGYEYRSTKPVNGFRETSLNTEKTKVTLLQAINHVPGAYGTQKADEDSEDVSKRPHKDVRIKTGKYSGKFGDVEVKDGEGQYRIRFSAKLDDIYTFDRKSFSMITYRTCYPCYDDINKADTLCFVVIIRHNTASDKLERVKREYPSIEIPQDGPYSTT